MQLIKNLIRKILNRVISRYYTPKNDDLLKNVFSEIIRIEHSKVKIAMVAPNHICRYRANSFSTKEPDTLKWFDSFKSNKVFWDIGANVGIYSIYVAKKKNAIVWAFEPSFFNLEILARNINLNGLQNKINIIPLAMNNSIGVEEMRHSTTEWGGALSSFGQNYGYDGKLLKDVFSYKTLGLSLDMAVKVLNVDLPDYVKIDVDGIEHLVLQGGLKTLSQAKEILVELNEDFKEQDTISKNLMLKMGFEIKSRGEYQHPSIRVANQIWEKKK